MKKIYYEKKNNRYFPISEYDDDYLNSFPYGATLIVSKSYSVSRKYNIDPDFAPMIAAGKYAEDDMANAIVAGLELAPGKKPLTKRQRELWRELSESFSNSDMHLIRPSAHDAVQCGVKAMQNEVEKMMTVSAVKQAYEHFMLVWKLTKENHSEE